MTSREMAEMEAYSSIEPFGFDMYNLMQAAICCATVAPWAKKGKEPKVSDFMFDFAGDHRDDGKITDPNMMVALFKGMAAHGDNSKS